MTIILPEIATDKDGTAWIEHTNTKVIEVVLNQRMGGFSPEVLAQQMPHLTPAQIYAALQYYSAHQPSVDAEIESRKTWVDATQAQAARPALERAALLGRIKTPA